DVRAEPAGELGGRALIDLDRLEGSAELGQGDGQRSVSWAPFDDRAVAAGGEFHDAGDGAAVAEEVLAQFMGSGMVTRHEGSWGGAEPGSRTGRPAGAGSGARSSGGREADPRRQRRRIRMKMALIPTTRRVRAPLPPSNGILGAGAVPGLGRHRGHERGSRHAAAGSTQVGRPVKTRTGERRRAPTRTGEKTPRRPS